MEGEDAGQEDRFGQLLADGLMGQLPHVHQCFCGGRVWREETRGGSVTTEGTETGASPLTIDY